MAWERTAEALLCWRRRGALLELEERGPHRDWEQRWSNGPQDASVNSPQAAQQWCQW